MSSDKNTYVIDNTERTSLGGIIVNTGGDNFQSNDDSSDIGVTSGDLQSYSGWFDDYLYYNHPSGNRNLPPSPRS